MFLTRAIMFLTRAIMFLTRAIVLLVYVRNRCTGLGAGVRDLHGLYLFNLKYQSPLRISFAPLLVVRATQHQSD